MFLLISVPVGAQELPVVRVIATGGTIASRPGDDQLTGSALIEAVPQLAGVAQVEVEEFSRIGSSGMTPNHWLLLAKRINELLDAEPDISGVVVTHGTDTMEETAYFLHLTIKDPRPVVLTGSMRSATAVSADGPANLLTAVRVAADTNAGGRGVLVVLNDEIHSARDVRKTDNNRTDTFVSVEWGALGVVDSDGVTFRRSGETLHTVQALPSVAGVETLPTVPIVADFVGNDATVLQNWIEQGVAGIVVQGFGGGRTSPEMRRAISEITRAGTLVVLASRVLEGRVIGSGQQAQAGVVAAGDLPSHKARVLLMLALLHSRDGMEIQAIFNTH
ncbi:MAG TPA: L-asparaginase [Gemmatimonadetes bacterium]|nr:L-asparaginase [Gemmatimonadota bacterium]|tara:strand:+ start:2537 stop:3535 length:999 start_codon:yes stop_codon:yes gene_type:complete